MNIELANGQVSSNRAGMLRGLKLEPDQRVVNAKAKARPEEDEAWGHSAARVASAH